MNITYKINQKISSILYKEIGKELINKIQEQLNNKCKIILLSAPNALKYYPKIGFKQHNSAWVLAQ